MTTWKFFEEAYRWAIQTFKKKKVEIDVRNDWLRGLGGRDRSNHSDFLGGYHQGGRVHFSVANFKKKQEIVQTPREEPLGDSIGFNSCYGKMLLKFKSMILYRVRAIGCQRFYRVGNQGIQPHDYNHQDLDLG